jgi:hypothetical protein
MPFDVQGALKAGYTLEEIGGHVGFDVQGAKKAGYGDDEILNHLANGKGKGALQPQKAESPGFLSNVNEALVKRGVNIANELTPGQESIGRTLVKAPERGLRVAGQGAAFLGDVLGEGVKSLYKTVVPDAAQEVISSTFKNATANIVDTRVGQAGIKAAQQGFGEYQAFKKQNPEAAKDLEAVVNIASLLPISKGGQVAVAGAKEGALIGRDLAAFGLRKTPQTIEKGIAGAVQTGIEKGIRPSVAGKSTAGQARQYFAKATDAVQNIVKNRNNLQFTNDAGEIITGQLPKNLREFSQAIDQTKRGIFDQYNAMALKAGQQEVSVDLQNTVKELAKAANDKILLDHDPGVAKYAADYAARLAERGSYTAVETQDAISALNRSLESFYKNPSYETASRAYIDSLVVNNLRNSLDTVIETSVGAGYKDLKRSYGALKAIEKDVNHRAMVDARKNAKGLIDFSDIFTGSTAVHGILTMNPALVGEAATAKGIANLYKKLNDPNRHVRKMFANAEKLMTRREGAASGFQPKSNLFRNAVNPPPGPQEIQAIPISGKLLPPGQGFEMGASSGPRALPAGQGFEILDPISAQAGRLGVALPPGQEIRQIPRFTGSAKSMEEIRNELPRMYQGNTSPVNLEQLNPELEKEYRKFLLRKYFK